jgi:hypothetical protein
LHSPGYEKYILPDEECVGPIAVKSYEGRIDLATGTGFEDPELQSEGAGSGLHIPQCGFSIRGIGRIDEHRNASR